MIAWVIETEFGVQYHPGHVRKLLRGWGFSTRMPTSGHGSSPTGIGWKCINCHPIRRN